MQCAAARPRASWWWSSAPKRLKSPPPPFRSPQTTVGSPRTTIGSPRWVFDEIRRRSRAARTGFWCYLAAVAGPTSLLGYAVGITCGPQFRFHPLAVIKDQEPQRNGSFPDADLATEGADKLAALTDNLKALAEEGLSPAVITAFGKQIATFRTLSTDENLLCAIGTNTAKREAALGAARTGLWQVSQSIARPYGNESPEYRSLTINEITRKSRCPKRCKYYSRPQA